jgi:GGDEF domain-containing protein
MATVNLTCTTCVADDMCERCRVIGAALRASGHAITRSTRYDALRAATVGSYGFEACVLPVARHERAIVDAASMLLNRARVALVAEPGTLAEIVLPGGGFALIEAADWRSHGFPTDWLTSGAVPAAPDRDETRSIDTMDVPPADVEAARRRLKRVATSIQRDLGVAGFPHDARLDLMAALEDEIAWAKMSGACFGLVLLHVSGSATSASTGGSQGQAERDLALLKEHIAAAMRASDLIAQGSDSLAVIVAEAAMEETLLVTSRIKKAVRKALKESAVSKAQQGDPRRISVGIAVYPTHGTARAALLARATAAAEPLR